MRWGVTQEAQNDHMTSAVCLKEIKNCQRISVGPDFVVSIALMSIHSHVSVRPLEFFYLYCEKLLIRTVMCT